MKYLKTYESSISYSVGDYVIIQTENIPDFIENNIGQIIKIANYNEISVKYENIPIKYKSYYFTDNNERRFVNSQILHCSKNKEDLEHILTANKYNL